MRKRIFAAFVCLCMLMALVPSMAYAGDTVSVGGLCEHHTQHDSACGYSEGTAEVPCNHEHTEDCYTLVTNCVHEHTAECYSGETTELICDHVCSEESGCITKELNCKHEHDEACGYVPATEGTPCNFVCEICNAPVAEEPECICDTKCTEEEVNADCPVCGGENGDISGCVGAAMMLTLKGARAITPTKPVNGDGSLDKPYEITSVAELYWFAEQVNGGNTGICAKLMNDITINENALDDDGNLIGGSNNLIEWTPIGSDVSNKYTGTFDGQNHTISGLYVVSAGDYAGLFGYVFGGTIKNVGVVNSYIRGSRFLGGVCGENGFSSEIENCYFLTGIATSGIGSDRGTATNVEAKEEVAFSSGEVAWLMNGSQYPQPWGQGSNDMPVLVNNLPEGVTDYKITVCVDVVTPENTTKYYIAKGSKLDESEYPSGYVFFEDASYTKWIDTARKTYDVNTTIYATSPVNSITLDKTALSLYVNDTETLTATVMPVTASQVLKWESSNPSVATVDQNGNVKAISRGEAVITAASIDGSGKTATCTVTVKKKSSSGSVFFWDLKFDTNGGSKIDTVTEWEYSTIDLDEYVPKKEGYKFVSWYADKDLTKKIDEVYLTKDTTVYAKWEKIEEEVSEEPEETEEIKETETISFKDVKESDWFYDAVSYVVENGLMRGMSEDIFAPNTPLTREMLAVVLYNVEGQPESTEANTFTDVKGDMWYTDAILWANENGIVAGYDNGAYGVGDLITREQFATILYRYAQFKGYDTTQGGMAVREFSDYESISDYARPAMAWAVNAGIMGGMDDGTLMPQGKATRAEVATMLMNFCENIVK